MDVYALSHDLARQLHALAESYCRDLDDATREVVMQRAAAWFAATSIAAAAKRRGETAAQADFLRAFFNKLPEQKP